MRVPQVAVGRRECLSVFGDDYDTVDGTGNGSGSTLRWAGSTVVCSQSCQQSTNCPGRCARLYSRCGSGKGTHSSFEEAERGLWVQGNKKGRITTVIYSHCTSTCITVTWNVFIMSAGLQPGDGERLLCAADGESHGESVRERGERPTGSCYVLKKVFWLLRGIKKRRL